MKKTKILFLLIAGALLILGFPRSSHAYFLMSDVGGSTEKLGQFIGELTYSYSSATQAQLVITLSNTSPVANGGYITAFAFNNPLDNIDTVSFSENDSSVAWNLLGGGTFDNKIPCPPFGAFDIGASITNDWLGGGNPHPGIAVGETFTFTFNFTGTNLNLLTDMSFHDARSSGGEFFLVRFRGFEDGGSDKVPATTPEPATMVLLGSGLLGLAGFARKRKK